MKIPETSANVGAYYGNEENGQWQPNGVIIDNGVGGGVVGSGDAGMHRPPVYPVHIPRGHVTGGYVMAGAYYPPPYPPVPPPQDDFADYMWMENEEEFDKQVMQQLEEEALMEQCIEAMLEDEQRERQRASSHTQPSHNYPTTSNGTARVSLEEAVSRSTLNPLAAEFVPTRGRNPPTHTVPPTAPPTPAQNTEEKPEPHPAAQSEAPSPHEEQSRTEASTTEEPESRPDIAEETKTEEPLTPPKDPPEVSAADIQPLKQQKRDPKKADPKKPLKTEAKKAKPVIVKSEMKVQQKKREVKSVKSEVRVEEKIEDVIVPVELPKPQTPTVEEPAPSGPKPINYAAAAKASKPKPKSTTPPADKPTAPTQKPEKPKTEPLKEKPKVEKKIQKERSVPKEKVNVQRKNSAK